MANEAPLTVGLLVGHSATLAQAASDLLVGLASGKYDSEVAITENILAEVGVVWPPAIVIDEALQAFLLFNKLTAPARVVPDGAGGYVPSTNSRYNPKTGEFI